MLLKLSSEGCHFGPGISITSGGTVLCVVPCLSASWPTMSGGQYRPLPQLPIPASPFRKTSSTQIIGQIHWFGGGGIITPGWKLVLQSIWRQWFHVYALWCMFIGILRQNLYKTLMGIQEPKPCFNLMTKPCVFICALHSWRVNSPWSGALLFWCRLYK